MSQFNTIYHKVSLTSKTLCTVIQWFLITVQLSHSNVQLGTMKGIFEQLLEQELPLRVVNCEYHTWYMRENRNNVMVVSRWNMEIIGNILIKNLNPMRWSDEENSDLYKDLYLNPGKRFSSLYMEIRYKRFWKFEIKKIFFGYFNKCYCSSIN